MEKQKTKKKNAFVLQLISFVSIHPSDKPFFSFNSPAAAIRPPSPLDLAVIDSLSPSLSLSSQTPLTSMVAGERGREEGRRRRGGRKKDEVASRIYRCGSCGCRRCINVLGPGLLDDEASGLRDDFIQAVGGGASIHATAVMVSA